MAVVTEADSAGQFSCLRIVNEPKGDLGQMCGHPKQHNLLALGMLLAFIGTAMRSRLRKPLYTCNPQFD